MCGIAGIISFDTDRSTHRRSDEAPLTLTRMIGRLTHRGPNDRGEEVLEGRNWKVGLGQTRLSIIDLSNAGHQPMRDALTGNLIVFNGEIYNFRELRRTLEAEFNDWDSASDTEVILKSYRKWGAQCVDHLRGMFAFAIWDASKSEVFVARDRLGIKPLYYYSDGESFLFASEVRAILATGQAPRRIDPIALNEYLSYQSIPSPRTLIEGVKSLPPGTWIKIDVRGGVTEFEYWNLLRNASDEAIGKSQSAIYRRTGELLREATELHLISDVPLGVFLSGGIDSSALVGLISEMGYTPRTFSVVFAESNFDESVYARSVADRFHTEHTEINLSEGAMLDQLPSALSSMDQPTGDGVNTYVVSKAVKEAGITVALSGLGGDEFFAGYPSFRRLEKAVRYMRALKFIPGPARSIAGLAVEQASGRSIQGAKTAAMIRSDGSLASMYPVLRQVLSSANRRSLLRGKWKLLEKAHPDPYQALLQQAYQSASSAELLARISYAEGRTYMHDVLLRDSDQMSMAHALELRVPLLDHKLVEYVMGVPDEYKRPNGTPKPLLVNSLKHLLPGEIVHRPKQGFTLPFANWMRRDLRKFCETRLAPERIESRGIFDPAEVSTLWRALLDGSREVSWSRLWVLVILEEWLEVNQIQCSI
jgi:asparagine synthase (glutamine-hydrolysing)